MIKSWQAVRNRGDPRIKEHIRGSEDLIKAQ